MSRVYTHSLNQSPVLTFGDIKPIAVNAMAKISLQDIFSKLEQDAPEAINTLGLFETVSEVGVVELPTAGVELKTTEFGTSVQVRNDNNIAWFSIKRTKNAKGQWEQKQGKKYNLIVQRVKVMSEGTRQWLLDANIDPDNLPEGKLLCRAVAM